MGRLAGVDSYSSQFPELGTWAGLEWKAGLTNAAAPSHSAFPFNQSKRHRKNQMSHYELSFF